MATRMRRKNAIRAISIIYCLEGAYTEHKGDKNNAISYNLALLRLKFVTGRNNTQSSINLPFFPVKHLKKFESILGNKKQVRQLADVTASFSVAPLVDKITYPTRVLR